MKYTLFLLLNLAGIVSSYSQNVGIGTETPMATLDVNGDVIFRVVDLIPPELTTIVLDVNATRSSVYRISGPVQDFTINGISAAIDGRMITLLNQSGFTMSVMSEDASVDPVDQIITGTNDNMTLADRGVIMLQYDSFYEKWIVKNTNKSGSGEGVWESMGNNAIFNEGYVGIGTEEPVSPLTVMTEVDQQGITQIGGPESITMATTIHEGSASIGTTTDHVFSLNAGGSPKVHIRPDGNVVFGDDPDPLNLTSGNTQSRMAPIPVAKNTLETSLNTSGWVHVATSETDTIVVDEAVGGVSASIGTLTDHIFRFKTNGLGRMHIMPLGQVTIGDNNVQPLGQLTVFTGTFNHGLVHASTNGFMLASHRAVDSGHFGTYSPNHFRLVCNSQNALNIISPSLNVGIGIDYPPEKLTVQTEENSFGISHRSDEGIILATHIGLVSASIGTHSDSHFRLVSNGLSRLHISADGKIGVGTINPLNLFEVKGTMRAQEVIVQTDNWPDYVFGADYRLRSLDELEQYITQNNHLPNIPPAEEIATEGLHLGEMQNTMMEKIEELTLYIIELKKEIDLLKNLK